MCGLSIPPSLHSSRFLIPDDLVAAQLWKKLTEANARLHAAEATEVSRGELSHKIRDLKRDLEHSRDSAIQKLRVKLDRSEAALEKVTSKVKFSLKRRRKLLLTFTQQAKAAVAAGNMHQQTQSAADKAKIEAAVRENAVLKLKNEKLANDKEELEEARSESQAEEKTLAEVCRECPRRETFYGHIVAFGLCARASVRACVRA